MKKTSSMLLIISPPPLFSFSNQPPTGTKSHFLFHKNVSLRKFYTMTLALIAPKSPDFQTFLRTCIHTYTYDITKLYVCAYVVCGNLLRVDLWPKTSKETMWRCTQVPLSQTLTPRFWILSRKCICFDAKNENTMLESRNLTIFNIIQWDNGTTVWSSHRLMVQCLF